MSADELIEKLMAARNKTTVRQHDIAFNAGLLTAAHIIRKHFDGRPAVDGKPLEVMTRDELLAYIRSQAVRAEKPADIFRT